MHRTTALVAMAATFVLGAAAARLLADARAADAVGNSAHIVKILAMRDEEIGPQRQGTNVRSRLLFAAPGATVSVQVGDVAKHFHRDSDEIQYIIEGKDSFWLGDHEREIGPGDLIFIPKGTAHAGSHATSGRFKAISIKTPPQAPDDVHPVD